MTEYLSNNQSPAGDGAVYGLPGHTGVLYRWMRVLAGGGTSEFSEIRMRGAIYDKNGVEILGGGGGGGSLASLSDVQIGIAPVPPLQNQDFLVYITAGGINKWVNIDNSSAAQMLPKSLDSLTDVQINAPASDRQLLTYNGGVGRWENSTRRGAFYAKEANLSSTANAQLVQASLVPIVSVPNIFVNVGATQLALSFIEPGTFQYNVVLEAIPDTNMVVTVSMRDLTTSTTYGSVMRQNVKHRGGGGEPLQFFLTGTIVVAPPPTPALYGVYMLLSDPLGTVVFSNIQLTITEV